MPREIKIVSTEDKLEDNKEKVLYTLKQGEDCNVVKTTINETNITQGLICDNEIIKLIESNIDIIIKIKEIPKFVKKYNNQIKIINDNVKVIDKFERIVKAQLSDQIKFLKSDDSILYINPFNKDEEQYWRVMDFNLPLIDTYQGLSDCITTFVNTLKATTTNDKIKFTYDIFPNNIGQLLVEKIKQLNLKAERKTKTGELLESLKKFQIPFKYNSGKIEKDNTIKSDINDILKDNLQLVNDIFKNKITLNTYAEYYNILGLYQYNTCNIYIEFLLYCINELLELVDNKTVLNLYLSKYTISLNRLKVIVRNSFYNLFPPKRATTKYNIQLTDKKVGVIEDVYFADKSIVDTIYEPNINYGLFLKGTDKIYDAYDSTMILSIGGFEITQIGPLGNLNKTILNFSLIPDDLKRISDKITIETNIKIINRFIKFLKEGLDSETREKIVEDLIKNLPETLSTLKSSYEDNMKRSLDYSLFIVNFETNMLNRNYNAKAKLIESLDEAKIFARYYNNVAKYILSNTEKKKGSTAESVLMKDFIIPCKKIEEEVRKRLEDKIKSIQTKVVNIRSNNIKTFNVTNYKEDEFWNRLQAIIYDNDFYIPVEKGKEIYLLPVIETAKRGKISDDKLVSEAKYFYSKFRDNVLYLAESKSQFSNNSSLRYLPNSFYEELYDSNDNKVKRLLFEVLNSPSKYTSATEKFNSNNSFVNRLLKYNNDLGFKSLSDNNRQIVAQNQIRAMIKSIM